MEKVLKDPARNPDAIEDARWTKDRIKDFLSDEFIRRTGHLVPIFGDTIKFKWLYKGKEVIKEGIFDRLSWKFEMDYDSTHNKEQFRLMVRTSEDFKYSHRMVEVKDVIWP